MEISKECAGAVGRRHLEQRYDVPEEALGVKVTALESRGAPSPEGRETDVPLRGNVRRVDPEVVGARGFWRSCPLCPPLCLESRTVVASE